MLRQDPGIYRARRVEGAAVKGASAAPFEERGIGSRDQRESKGRQSKDMSRRL